MTGKEIKLIYHTKNKKNNNKTNENKRTRRAAREGGTVRRKGAWGEGKKKAIKTHEM